MSQHHITACQPAARARPRQPWLAGLAPLLALFALLMAGPVGSAQAQTTAAAPAAAAPVFKDEELDQMLAPIALYPDSLLAQVLMASTYPADVKDAATWSKAHPDTKGDEALKQVDGQEWDPSVKSLAAFPQVLAMMGAKPDDVQRLGDAFLADPKRVMDRVQFLRKKAQEAGNLKTTEQQKVTTTTEASKQVIVIEPAQPTVVYVPAYQPTVYGSWWYPSYPPYYWPPPPYYYPPGGAFVAGVFWGAAIVGISNGLWGGCNWGRGDVNINVNKYNNVNVNNKINNGDFNHNASRRGDVPYRDSKSQSQYGQKARDGASSRESYRGKDGQAGGRDAQRASAESTLKSRGADPAAGRDALQGADRGRAEAATRDAGRGGSAGAASRDVGGGAGAGNRDFGGGGSGASGRDFGGASSGASNRASSNNALAGAGNSSASRADASRGQSSRSSMSSGGGASRASAGGGGGGARGGGGGGGRGGGGRR